MKPARKRPLNISLDPALVVEARRLGLVLSEVFSAHLAEVVKARQEEEWQAQNREAFAAYDRFVSQHGVWNEEDRGW